MRLTMKTASGWLIRLALTAALLLWEYAAANGTNKKKKEKNLLCIFIQAIMLICRFLFLVCACFFS